MSVGSSSTLLKFVPALFGVLWGALNFTIYFDAGADRALMVGIHFGAAAYFVTRAWIERIA